MEENELNIDEEFVQSAEEVAELAGQEQALVEYVPKSKAPFRLNTLIPRNMAFEVQKALNRVIKINGNIDNYVRNNLKYRSTDELWKALGAEQVDSLGLYLSQFNREQGVIIADQTGIGKGRQAAAVIRHALMNGYLPVFFTKKTDLFSDMYRDLQGIDFADIHPFIVNTDSLAKIKDSNGNVVFAPLTAKDQLDTITTIRTVPTESKESIEWHKKLRKSLPDPDVQPTVEISDTIDYLPSDYNCIFCTYSQVQSAHPSKRLWLAKLAEAGVEGSKKYKKTVFILDESHTAGGVDSIIGIWMRSVLPHSKACCYLSATFAKYPQVMPLYAKKTAIQETGLRDSVFVGAMQWGGLALQEIVASNLAESGQLIRRQRSNEGVRVEYITLDEEPARSLNRERVNRIIHIMNMIVAFEEEHVVPIMGEIHREARKKGEYSDSSPKSLGVKFSPYFSRVFNIVDQMLFSLKVEEVAKKCIELLNEDKKVVIAFKSTMGAFLKDLNLVNGDVILPEQLDFVRTLIKGLDSVFSYSYTDINGEKSRRKVDLESISSTAFAKYTEIKNAILAESSGLSISPIDQLINIIENTPKKDSLGGHKQKHFKVAEVTGRNQRVRFDENEAVVQTFRTDTEKFFRLFNAGDYDVLLINATGSTGSSAHASKDFVDQRVRAMIIHQFELDINTEIQKRGRINRTGQVELPEYYYITSDIPTEQRLMTMLKGKLKSLDANTTGSQKTSDDTLKSPDFFNKYGDKVAWEWITENPLLAERMGHPSFHIETTETGERIRVRNESKEGSIKQLTGRAGLLNVEEQEILYKELLERYEHRVEWEKQRGTYDLEIEFLKLDADIKKRFLHKKGHGGKTPFGKDTVRDESIVNNLKRPFTKDEIDERIIEKLQGRKARQVRKEFIVQVKEEYPEIVKQLIQSRLDTIEKLVRELEELPDIGSADTEEDNAKLEYNREKLQDLVATKKTALSDYELDLENVLEKILRYIDYWDIGTVLKIPILGTEFQSWGVFLGINFGKSKNPYTLGNINLTFAVADSRKQVDYNLQNEQISEISRIYTESKDVPDEEKDEVLSSWNEIVKEASAKREKRHILSENIVAASDTIGSRNKLIKYNTKEGSIRNGIILSRDNDDRIAAQLPISNAEPIIRNLDPDSQFSDQQFKIRFKGLDNRVISIYISKKGNQELYTDRILRSLILRNEGQSEDELADFVQNAGDMTSRIQLEELTPFLERLDTFGIHYFGESKELEDWEIENEDDWQKKTEHKGSFRYKLSRPYGKGSNPVSGFLNYEEPSPTNPFGVVVYNRPVKDVEKFNYSLIPIFSNPEEPYLIWKSYVEVSALKSDFTELLEKVKDSPINEAIMEIGYFITNNPHEDGNTEFVFGEYTEEDLGRVAYEDHFGMISMIDQLIEQLTIELQEV